MNNENKLSKLRQQHGLTQQELAEKLNVSRQAISRWESGVVVPSTDNLKYLSQIYGVTVDYLLKDDVPLPEKREEKAGAERKEASEPEEKESWWKRRSKTQIGIISFVLGFVLAIGIAFAVSAYQEWDENRIVPQDEMEREVEDSSFDGSFDFD